MTELQFQKPWEEVKELLKEINGTLTNQDLLYEKREEKELFSRLQMKIDMSDEALKGWTESVSYNDGKAS